MNREKMLAWKKENLIRLRKKLKVKELENLDREVMLDWKKANLIRLRKRKEKSNSMVSCGEYDEEEDE